MKMDCVLSNLKNITEIYDASLNNQCNKSWGSTHVDDPTAFITYFIAGAVCFVLSTVVFLKYNSVTVMNVTVRSRSISNTSWIIYFVVSAIRSVVGGVLLVYGPSARHSINKELYFFIDTILMSLGVSCLAWVLNHQRIFRAAGFLSQEISRFNSKDGDVPCNERPGLRQTCNHYLLSVQAVIVGLFLVANIVLLVLGLIASPPVWLYGLYLGSFWCQCIIVIILAAVIVKNANAEGPKPCTKGLFIIGVVLTLPADIPASVWTSCIYNLCNVSHNHAISLSDLAIILFIFSAVVFFVALRREFLRLNQEAQWSAVRDAESLYGPSL